MSLVTLQSVCALGKGAWNEVMSIEGGTGMLSALCVNKGFNGDCQKRCMSEVTVKINGKEMELNPFTKNVVESAIKGLLSAFKGYEEGDISITIKQ